MEKKAFWGRMNSSIFSLLPACLVFAVLFTGVSSAYSAVTQTAVVATAAADYSSVAHSVISVDPIGGPRTAQNDLLPTISDITVAAYESYFYRMERFGANNVAKLQIDAPDTVIWQYSTEGADVESNPHDLVFASSEKAYLLRYGSTKAWIVNPSATTEAEFKIGELPLSSYADQDGLPEMHSGVIVGGKLFITLQRLEWWSPTVTAYIAVFDITTDEEIETGKGEDGRKGIPLDIKNPGAIQYLAENDTIYVQGVGSYFPVEYTGGIVSVDPDTYDTALVLDDGTDANHPYGQISGMAIVSATKGYFVGYDGWGDNTLYSFNPTTGNVGNAVDGLVGKGIAGMESGVYADKNGMLWVCNQTDARIDILNTTDDAIDESVSTNLNPLRVVFCDEGSPDDGDSGGGGDSGGDSGCFIATAAYGSYMQPNVKILRDFRDTYLLHNRLGRAFVNAYYRYSPPIADYIAESSALKTAARIGLAPIVGISYVLLHTTAMQMAALFSLLFGVSLIAWLTLRTSRE